MFFSSNILVYQKKSYIFKNLNFTMHLYFENEPIWLSVQVNLHKSQSLSSRTPACAHASLNLKPKGIQLLKGHSRRRAANRLARRHQRLASSHGMLKIECINGDALPHLYLWTDPKFAGSKTAPPATSDHDGGAWLNGSSLYAKHYHYRSQHLTPRRAGSVLKGCISAVWESSNGIDTDKSRKIPPRNALTFVRT